MGKTFRETLNERLQDPEFKAEWDALESEFQQIKSAIDCGTLEQIPNTASSINHEDDNYI